MSSSQTDDVRLQENRCVLDASAMLAAILHEPGAELVETAMEGEASISSVNLSEVIARLADFGLDYPQTVDALRLLRFRVVGFDQANAWRAGLLRSRTRHLGLSLGERACLALASGLGVPAMTADRAWSQLDIDVRIELLR